MRGARLPCSPLRRPVLAAEADRRRVVVELREADLEPLGDGEGHVGEQRGAVGVEEPVQGAADPVVADVVHIGWLQPVCGGGERRDRLRLAVNRLPLHHDGAQQHQEPAGVGQGHAPVPGRDVALQDLRQPHARQEVIDERQRPQPLRAELERASGNTSLRAAQSVAIINDRQGVSRPMAQEKRDLRRQVASARIARIKDRIRALDHVCSGTLLKRTKVCGKPSCRCAEDPKARHGPYYEWGRMKGGKLVHRMVSRGQAKALRAAIRNYRAIRRLLRAWEAETVKIIDTENKRQ